jgi:hypothetical protein
MEKNNRLSLVDVSTIYFDETAIRLPDYTVGRIPFNKGGRGYYIINPDYTVSFFVSLTTAIGTTQPTSPQIIEWQMSLGSQEYKRQLRLKADYGTIMHELIGKFCIDKKLAMSYIDEAVSQYRAKGFNDKEIDDWNTELRKDLRAWAQFVIDYNLTVICVEVVLVSKQYGYATAIDVVAYHDEECMVDSGETYKSGERKGEVKMVKGSKRSLCLINMKSGRKGFYESHSIQMEAEKRVFEENFSDLPISKIYNWAPTDWKTNPAYKLKDQTDCCDPKELDAIFALAEFRLKKNVGNVLVDEGQIEYGVDATSGMSSVSMEQYILDYYNVNEDISTENGIDLTL